MKNWKRLPAILLFMILLLTQTVFAETAGASGKVIVGSEAAPSSDASGIDTSGKNATVTDTASTADAAAAEIAKPSPASESAALYDATTGQFLFTKNGDKAMYPASITKVMTVLLAAEKLSLSDEITFKASATDNLESGYTNVKIVSGDTMNVKDAMYAVLLKSACEVSNGLAEEVSGTQTAFAELMNARAKELGCTNTNFRNASGLNDASHYTTAHDMALITAAAFANPTFRAVASTGKYTLPASKKRGSLTVSNSNKMLFSSNAEYMEGIVGGKTGYTSKAGNTLVEALDYKGHELIAVVMKSNGKQYSDAKALFEYGKLLIDASEEKKTAQTGAWENTSEGKKYRHSDGKYAVNEWLNIDGEEYFFGSDGLMAKGWKCFTNGAWYYFNMETGAMVHDKWVSPDGIQYFYLQSNGVMATDTVIDGTYRVDSNGIYVEKVG